MNLNFDLINKPKRRVMSVLITKGNFFTDRKTNTAFDQISTVLNVIRM
jgi:hypothetical protein